MGKINLLIANANNTFTANEISIFRSAAKAAENFISVNFEFDYDVDVVVTEPPFPEKTIHEDGIGGRTYNSRLIILVIDKQQTAITEDVVFEFICHEMSHSLRWEKLPNEYADTLFNSVILEGLAVVLEEKAISDTNRRRQEVFLTSIQETDDKMIKSIISELKTKFDNDQYDYEKIFFTGDDKLPRWAGYRLGYYLVKRYLEQADETIEQATLVRYDQFRGYGNEIIVSELPDAEPQKVDSDRLPLLIVVSGAPGAGKTTFARALAAEMKILHFERDRLFWSVEFTTGITKIDRQKVGIPLFYKVVEQLLADKLSLVVDGTLYKGASETEIGRLQNLADIVNVHCRAENTTQRFHDRLVPEGEDTPEWIEKHMEHLEKIKPFVERPLEIDWDVIEVDTNGAYKPSVKEIAEQFRTRRR